MTEHRKPAFKWEPRQPRADDPLFGKTHVAAVSFPVQPKPSTDKRPGGEVVTQECPKRRFATVAVRRKRLV